MRIVFFFLACFAAAQVASAYTHVHETFEGAFPPPGWTAGMGWTTGTSPFGICAMGEATGSGNFVGFSDLETYDLNVGPNRRLYYDFVHHAEWGMWYAGNGTYFKLYYPTTNQTIVKVPINCFYFEHVSGSAWIGKNLPVRAVFRVTASSFSWHYASAGMWVDNVVITDDPQTGVAPASLGRVKAIYR